MIFFEVEYIVVCTTMSTVVSIAVVFMSYEGGPFSVSLLDMLLIIDVLIVVRGDSICMSTTLVAIIIVDVVSGHGL